mmetsp:Transcript_25044/g.66005  ORF Transcript_25044/g.66005 Transcript_25044/m.66005 type:complete len:223 (+) Transcript_25044:147-815(+)
MPLRELCAPGRHSPNLPSKRGSSLWQAGWLRSTDRKRRIAPRPGVRRTTTSPSWISRRNRLRWNRLRCRQTRLQTSAWTDSCAPRMCCAPDLIRLRLGCRGTRISKPLLPRRRWTSSPRKRSEKAAFQLSQGGGISRALARDIGEDGCAALLRHLKVNGGVLSVPRPSIIGAYCAMRHGRLVSITWEEALRHEIPFIFGEEATRIVERWRRRSRRGMPHWRS